MGNFRVVVVGQKHFLFHLQFSQLFMDNQAFIVDHKVVVVVRKTLWLTVRLLPLVGIGVGLYRCYYSFAYYTQTLFQVGRNILASSLDFCGWVEDLVFDVQTVAWNTLGLELHIFVTLKKTL